MKKLNFTVAILVMTIITGCLIYSRDGRNFNHHAKKQVNASSPLQPDAHIYTNLTHMDITVTGQDTNECVLVADLSISAVSQEIADTVREQLDIELVQEPDRLMIMVQKPQEYKDDYCVSGKMTINVPVQTRLEMTTTHGDGRFENIESAVNIRSTHGDFVFDDIRGDLIAATTHGDVRITNTQNTSVRINTTHGKISLKDCTTQKIHCSTTHDPIRLEAVLADCLDLQTSHDPIELTACTAEEAVLITSHGAIRGDVGGIERVTARTSHAPIHLRCVNESCPNFSATLNTTHGNIELYPPVGFAGRVSASTSHGRIRTDGLITEQDVVDDTLNGTIGQGTGSITLTSTHGNIILKRAESSGEHR